MPSELAFQCDGVPDAASTGCSVDGDMRCEERFSRIGAVLPTVRLHGVAVHAITERQCVNYIMDQLVMDQGGWVVTPNLDHLRRLVRDESFAGLCADATLMVADGMPLVWASWLQGTPLPQRVAGSSLISTLTAAAAQHGKLIFLLGGDAGTADQAAEVLRRRYPGLQVAGTYYPPMGFESDPEAMADLAETLRRARPDIVFVALGSPKQEQLITRLRREVPEFASTWWLGVGISFSFLCGRVERAPRWLQVMGLEWLHRLVQEPKRLAKRYLVQGIPFAVVLWVGAVAVRVRNNIRAVRA